ncbi:MAG TPA: hypothetical protein VN228_14815 [Pyrinomonadaceae bacterium]|nr:hypothetical protein [Pyrinomonadaceae bacterium]
MNALSTSKLLRVWERALGEVPAGRSLALLAAACPEMSPEELASLSVGRRDRMLLALRERTFGPRLVGLAPCGACGEGLELSFDVADISAGQAAEAEGELTAEADGYEVRFRLPNSVDLLAVAARGDAEGGRQHLLARCLLRAARGGAPVAFEELPDGVLDAVESRMAEADPQADVRLALTCPACGHRWLATFDVVSYFWSEVNAWAYRVLGEVHRLASAYGWREEDILAMSPWRRHVYLEMVGG